MWKMWHLLHDTCLNLWPVRIDCVVEYQRSPTMRSGSRKPGKCALKSPASTASTSWEPQMRQVPAHWGPTVARKKWMSYVHITPHITATWGQVGNFPGPCDLSECLDLDEAPLEPLFVCIAGAVEANGLVRTHPRPLPPPPTHCGWGRRIGACSDAGYKLCHFCARPLFVFSF